MKNEHKVGTMEYKIQQRLLEIEKKLKEVLEAIQNIKKNVK